MGRFAGFFDRYAFDGGQALIVSMRSRTGGFCIMEARLGRCHSSAITKRLLLADRLKPVVIVLAMKILAYPPVAHCAFPRGHQKINSAYPLLVIGGDLSQGVNDLGQITK